MAIDILNDEIISTYLEWAATRFSLDDGSLKIQTHVVSDIPKAGSDVRFAAVAWEERNRNRQRAK